MFTFRLTTRQILLGATAAALVVYKLWLVGIQDVYVKASPMDDLYFVRTAQQLVLGNWLGTYTQYTLMAGPFYPMWIALSYLVSVPLHAAQGLLYAGTCLTAVMALRPLVRHRGWLLLAFAYLLFNPFTYDFSSSAGVFRVGIYPTLSLLVVSCAVGLYVRAARVDGRPLRWALALGVSLVAFWYTREEGVWIVPTLLLTALFTLIHGRSRGRREWKTLLAVVLVVPAIWVVAFLGLAYTNWKHYGVFTDLEIKSAEFKQAYSALISVQSDQRRQYILMEDAAKRAIAAQSPAFAELAPHIRSGELAVNFIWALRDAVQSAGYYDRAGLGDPENGRVTLEFYRRLGQEVGDACDSGRLTCDRLLVPFIPAWEESYTRIFIPTFNQTLDRVLHFYRFEPRMSLKRLSSGSYRDRMLFSYMTNERVRTANPSYYNTMPPAQRETEKHKTKRLLRIGSDYYLHPAPWPFVIAVAGLVLALAVGLWRRRLGTGAVVGLIVLAAMFSYLLLTTLVGVMAVVSHRYLHVSIALMLFYVVVGTMLLVQTLGSLRDKRTGSA
jgi:hypothetical protein